jgi:Flp pilus assembly protein TadD
MRFAEHVLRPALLAAAAAALGGCASMQEPLKALQQAVTLPGASANSEAAASAARPANEAPKSAASPATTAPVAASAAAVPMETEAPVNPAVQRAYDDARRLLAAGRTDDAERAFRAIAKANPDLGGPHANLGLIYRQAGKLAEAVAELELAVRVNPKQALYFNQLGIAQRQHGQFAKAREAYQRALELDAGYSAATLNLGILNDLYLGDRQRALELYERYQALTAGKDASVTKWVAELKNRKPEQRMLVKREQP